MEETVKLFSRYRVPILVEKKQWETEKRNSKKKTHEEYVEELNIKNPNVEVIGKYVNAKTKITHRCLIHDVYWEVSPTSVLKGGGCRNCQKEKLHNSSSKTHSQYIEELKIKNPTVIPLDEYVNNDTKIKHLCLIHGIEWMNSPHNVLQGKGCTECLKERIANKNKKTNEDYVEELKIKNPNAIVLEKYIDYNTPILHLYKKCNHQVKVSPASILQGHDCKICRDKKTSERCMRSHSDYVEELAIKNPNLEVLEEYSGSNIPILHLYKECGHQTRVVPASALHGYGCKQCANKNVGERLRKTHDSYVQEVEVKNPNIIVLGKYINNGTPILHLHKQCGHQTMMRPASVLDGNGCVICKSDKIGKKCLKTHEQYIEQLTNKNISLVPIEQYINDRTKIKHRCLIHNTICITTPNNALHGKGCKQCGLEKISKARRKTHLEYIEELHYKHIYLSVLEQYDGANTPILHSCDYGHTFKMTPSIVLHGGSCPICNCNYSKGEQEIIKFLKSHNIIFLRPYTFDNLIGINGGLLSYDFYLPTYNLLIEFQGEQHEHPIKHFGGIKKFIKQKIHDRRKRVYCHDNNINLLEIWYYEINKVDKILEQYLNNLKLETVETTGVA